MMLQAKRSDGKKHINPHTSDVIKDVCKEKMKTFTVVIPESLHRKFKIKVVSNGQKTTMHKEITKMIEKYTI